ncbi:MAG: hypothetical protein A3H96_11455 [Acidobacteria bacterium RIFCSPLOWO2_02_FULL_67_36]|nr:MAG: hypothetical protein A3H96_11455 [Acidobacteria bacterium RIFCSPLOWO2_02_FULL_67_36]OGA76291.1 MAG: hypothetical protein A3G27_05760 [Betaproteobacteria bacterium RIFCSPLOWO2_12_FULL_66_14]
MTLTIIVRYSCGLCGLYRVECVLPARGEEDVPVWMDATVRLLCLDHSKRSPRCHATELRDIMVTISGLDRIGWPVLQ